MERNKKVQKGGINLSSLLTVTTFKKVLSSFFFCSALFRVIPFHATLCHHLICMHTHGEPVQKYLSATFCRIHLERDRSCESKLNRKVKKKERNLHSFSNEFIHDTFLHVECVGRDKTWFLSAERELFL